MHTNTYQAAACLVGEYLQRRKSGYALPMIGLIVNLKFYDDKMKLLL